MRQHGFESPGSFASFFMMMDSGCRKRWATFIGGLASFDVIFSTVGRRTLVGGARVVRRRPARRSAGRSAGRPARRPAGRSSTARGSSAAPKKIHLIEAAPFGRLDQMLSTIV